MLYRFLSAKLHMDHLSRQGTTFHDMKEALKHLPASALGAFKASTEQIAQQIRTNSRNGEDLRRDLLKKHILLWVSHAKVDINIEQIQDSFAIQKSEGQCYRDHRPEGEMVMRACTVLVKRSEDRTFSLVHKSVKGHLLHYKVIPNNADLEMGKTCLYFLINQCKKKRNSPLLQYAAKHWWSHLSSGEQVLDEKTDGLVMKLLKDSSNLAKAFKAMKEVGGGAFDGMTGWHAAVHFDLLSWAERLATDNVNAQCSDGQTALHWAVRYNRCKFVELLIRKSANPNIRDRAGNTPLHKALVGPATDDVSIVEALIKGGAQLDIRNENSVSPLEIVIQYGPTSIAKLMIESQKDVSAEIFEDWTLLRYVLSHGQEIFGVVDQEGLQTKQLQVAVRDHVNVLTELLLERGVDLNRPSTKDKWQPLVFATRKGDLSLMERLLTRKPGPAKVDAKDREGKTLLWGATHHEMPDAIQLLLKYGADVSEACRDGSTPLYEAVRKKSSKLVQLLISAGANVNTKTANASTLLIEATKLQDHDTAWVLLNAGAKPDQQDADGKSALHFAIEKQDNDLVWLLISKGATVTAPSLAKTTSSKNTGVYMQNPLILALRVNNDHAVWLLCEHGASPNAAVDDKGRTLLHLAVYNRNLTAARVLANYGASMDVQEDGGLTPLHYAVLVDREDIVTLLASHAANPSSLDTLDTKDNTALSLAVQKKHPAIVQILIRHGVSCNAADSRGLTALHHAARLGFKEGLRILLDGGGDPNAVDHEAFTPVHHAINGGCSDAGLVKMLADASADLEMRDGNRRTPLMLAAQLGNAEMVSCLLDAGVDTQAQDGGGYTAFQYGEKHPDIQKLLGEHGDCHS